MTIRSATTTSFSSIIRWTSLAAHTIRAPLRVLPTIRSSGLRTPRAARALLRDCLTLCACDSLCRRTGRGTGGRCGSGSAGDEDRRLATAAGAMVPNRVCERQRPLRGGEKATGSPVILLPRLRHPDDLRLGHRTECERREHGKDHEPPKPRPRSGRASAWPLVRCNAVRPRRSRESVARHSPAPSGSNSREYSACRPPSPRSTVRSANSSAHALPSSVQSSRTTPLP